MRRLLLALGLLLAHASGGAAPLLPAAARQEAPNDGWAGVAGGTRGGSGAAPAGVAIVSDAAGLRAALARTDDAPRIIGVSGTIDMSEGRPYTSRADQAQRGLVRLPAHTTLVGVGPDAGLVHAHLLVAEVSQVIIRNLALRNPRDVATTWDPRDGNGDWNAGFDAITISASDHVWVDHNSFSDEPDTDDRERLENGKRKGCRDGALDIRDGADYITVSYNRFALPGKTMLVGAGDDAVEDVGHLRVTLSNNLFDHVASGAPRVRFGQVHLFNNLHIGARRHPVYPHEYGVGVARAARIVSEANVYEIAGARSCRDAVRSFDDSRDPGVFTDSGSLLNGATLAPCGAAGSPAWTVPYPFVLRPAIEVRAHVLARAGAGKLVEEGPVPGCPTAGFVYCEDFAWPGRTRWQGETPGRLPEDAFTVADGRLRTTGSAPTLLLAEHGQLPGLAQINAFVEARVQLGAGTRRLYLVGRYRDARNWVGAGIEAAPDSDTMHVKLVELRGGVRHVLKRVPRARLPADRFAMLRLEMRPTQLAVYLDGERITISPQLPAPGGSDRIGLFSAGGGADIDDLRAGVPDLQPARIAPSLADARVQAASGDPPRWLAVSALASDGATRLAFDAVSSDPAVAGVSLRDHAIEIVPKAAGRASIVLTARVDRALQSTVDVHVTAPFAAPRAAFAAPAALRQALSPVPGMRDEPIDTSLRIRFDHPPKLGATGSVRILRASDGALVDIIHLGEEVRALGYPGQPRGRHVRMTPITVEGNDVLIRPHPGRLAHGETYAVVVGDGVVDAATLGRQPFRGLGKGDGWTFRTRGAAPTGATLVVDDDGPADFRTVQGALNHAMAKLPRAAPATIEVRNGRYEELLFILGKDKLRIVGESRDGVVIQARNNDGVNPGSGASQAPGSPSFSGGRALLAVEEADLLTLENLTLRNTTLRGRTRSGQAETLYFNNDAGRLVVKNASFHSEQDTIQVKGYAWFYRTLVEGNVDFVWGANRAALFEESELRSVGDSGNPASGGYLVQARTVGRDDPGFVFLNSVLTHGPGPAGNGVPRGATYLARSPGTANTWDNVAFLNCRMGEHVAEAGWAGAGVGDEPAPNPPQASAGRGWREYGSMDLQGRPLDLSRRSGGYTMSAQEVVERFGGRGRIFAGFGGGQGWEPVP